MLLGYFSSCAALENIWKPSEAVSRLLEELPDLASSPARTIRQTQELDSARDRSPSPEEGDIEGFDGDLVRGFARV